jgi:hypothetical protein
MKLVRSFVVHAPALCVALALAGCGSAPDSTAPASNLSGPTPSAVPASMIAQSTLTQTGWAGFAVVSVPTVEVLDQNGRPVPNVNVSFTVAEGGGSVSNTSSTTSQTGFAGTDWVLGNQSGTNTVVASVKDLSPISFQAHGKPVVIVARYNLVEIGGRTLPVTYSGGGATWAVTGGHYYLASDSTFSFGYEINGASNTRPIGTTVWVDQTTLQFYQGPGSYPDSQFYQQRNGLFATGRIEGTTMTVTYEDFIDFEVEKYVASGG